MKKNYLNFQQLISLCRILCCISKICTISKFSTVSKYQKHKKIFQKLIQHKMRQNYNFKLLNHLIVIAKKDFF